jgi:hypothetical protein
MAKITKSSLLQEIDLILQDLQLVKSALLANPHPKQAELEDLKTRFEEVVGRARK